jgi:polysaccharide pyruvyl transferase WcaK-like protein
MVMVHNPIEDDDTRVYARLASRIRAKQSLTLVSPKSYKESQKLLARANFAVATRMHSAILALTVHTPFLTIGYGHKSLGFIQSLELKNWYIDITKVNKTNLVDLTMSFIKPKNLVHLRRKLKTAQTQLLKQKPLLMQKLTLFLKA